MQKDTQEQALAQAQARAVGGEIACADAHEIAEALGLSPREIGVLINRSSELRFFRCQLGVFGYGLKTEGESKIVHAAQRVPPDIDEAIDKVAKNGRVSCADLWDIADRVKYPRLQLGNIAEAKGLKITPCQLGCF